MSNTSKIYVDLASLLDLRQGTLYQLVQDKEKLADYIQSEEYNFRVTDTFPIVEQAQYDRLYQSASVDIIPHSIVTHILVSLKSKLHNIEMQNTYQGENKTPEILLNVYPYTLTENQSAQLQNMLFIKLASNTLVSVINIPPHELTPYFMTTSGFTAAFIYDFQTWMNHHAQTLEKSKMMNVILYFPSIFKKEPTKEDSEKIIKMGFKDVFSYTEYLFSSVVSLNFLPTVFYTNLVTANSYISKFNDSLKAKGVSKPEDDEKYKDIAEQVDATNLKE